MVTYNVGFEINKRDCCIVFTFNLNLSCSAVEKVSYCCGFKVLIWFWSPLSLLQRLGVCFDHCHVRLSPLVAALHFVCCGFAFVDCNSSASCLIRANVLSIVVFIVAFEGWVEVPLGDLLSSSSTKSFVASNPRPTFNRTGLASLASSIDRNQPTNLCEFPPQIPKDRPATHIHKQLVPTMQISLEITYIFQMNRLPLCLVECRSLATIRWIRRKYRLGAILAASAYCCLLCVSRELSSLPSKQRESLLMLAISKN